MPPKRGERRIDAAYDKLVPLGFSKKEIKAAIDSLLKIYGAEDRANTWKILEEEGPYESVIDLVLERRAALIPMQSRDTPSVMADGVEKQEDGSPSLNKELPNGNMLLESEATSKFTELNVEDHKEEQLELTAAKVEPPENKYLDGPSSISKELPSSKALARSPPTSTITEPDIKDRKIEEKKSDKKRREEKPSCAKWAVENKPHYGNWTREKKPYYGNGWLIEGEGENEVQLPTVSPKLEDSTDEDDFKRRKL